ncbi:putative ribonuclease H-like domain-containing protein [Tanacetum coccineum]
MDLPNGKRANGTKWVYKNKKDEKGIVIKNKARLVAQGFTQEEGIDYDEVFAPIAKIEVIRLFLAYASFKDFMVYQMDVKSVFLYGKIEEEVYVCQPPGFEDPDFPDRVYKVEKALYELHQAPKAWKKGDILLVQVYVDGLQVKQKEDGFFIIQDKYVTEILKKFGFSDVKTASTSMETHKPLLKDADGEDVDEHLYRSMIGSLMYLTSSRPDIMFAVLTMQEQVYRNSTTGGCQFLGCRLISWQCKKQAVVAYSIIEAEYIAASNCCGQTKCIDIRHHFIRDSNEKKLIQMIKIHTDQNVTDLLTKAFDVIRFKYLIAMKTINGEVQLQSLVDGKKVIITETSVRRDLHLEVAEGTEDENVPTTSNDPLLSGEDRLKLTELMDLCTNLQNKVLDLEKANTAQDSEIASLKKRFKKLERRNKSRTLGLKRLRKLSSARRLESSDEASLEVTLVDETQGRNDEEMFYTCILDGEEVFVEQDVVEKEVSVVDPVTTADEVVTTASVKVSTAEVAIDSATTTTDKGKAKMIEPEKPLKKKDQIMYDQEVALNLQAQLQAELEEEERLAR